MAKGKEFQPRLVTKIDREGKPTETKYATYRNKFAKIAGRELSLELAKQHDVKITDTEGKTHLNPEAFPLHHFPPHTPCLVQRYRKTDLIKWPMRGGEGQKEGTKIDRESLKQSRKSRTNCAFKFMNSERDFETMLLLSWPGEMHNGLSYDDVAGARGRFLKRLKRKFPGIGYGWFLEFGEVNGNPHFHMFLTNELQIEKWEQRLRENSNDIPVYVPSPNCETLLWIVSAWMGAAKITSQKARNFNVGYFDKVKGYWTGTMIERLREPDAAAKYTAKEASKRVQKSAPWPVSQWWYLSPCCQPKVREETDFSAIEFMQNFPENPVMMSKLFTRLEVKKKAA